MNLFSKKLPRSQPSERHQAILGFGLPEILIAASAGVVLIGLQP